MALRGRTRCTRRRAVVSAAARRIVLTGQHGALRRGGARCASSRPRLCAPRLRLGPRRIAHLPALLFRILIRLLVVVIIKHKGHAHSRSPLRAHRTLRRYRGRVVLRDRNSGIGRLAGFDSLSEIRRKQPLVHGASTPAGCPAAATATPGIVSRVRDRVGGADACPARGGCVPFLARSRLAVGPHPATAGGGSRRCSGIRARRLTLRRRGAPLRHDMLKVIVLAIIVAIAI